MSFVTLNQNDLRVLRLIIEHSTELGSKIKNHMIPLTVQEARELCIKIGADYKPLNLYV